MTIIQSLKLEVKWSFDQFVRNVDNIQPIKSDLDVHLEEGTFLCADNSDLDFDALEW